MKGIIACLCFGGLCGIAGTTALAVESEGFRNFAQINKDELAIIQKQEESLNEQGKELAQAKEITETITKENEQIKADKTALSAELETAKADLETALANGELQESEIEIKQAIITELENQINNKNHEEVLNSAYISALTNENLLSYRGAEKIKQDFENKIIPTSAENYGITEIGFYDIYTINATGIYDLVYFDGVKLYRYVSDMFLDFKFPFDEQTFLAGQVAYFVKRNDISETYVFDRNKVKVCDNSNSLIGKEYVVNCNDLFKVAFPYGNIPYVVDNDNYVVVRNYFYVTIFNKQDPLNCYKLSYNNRSYSLSLNNENLSCEVVEIKDIDFVYQDNISMTAGDLSYRFIFPYSAEGGTPFAVGSEHAGYQEWALYSLLNDCSYFSVDRSVLIEDPSYGGMTINFILEGRPIEEEVFNVDFKLYDINGEEISIETIQENGERDCYLTLLSVPTIERDENGNMISVLVEFQVQFIETIAE